MPLSALFAALALGAPIQSEPDPFDLLRRSLCRKPGVNVDALVEKPFQGGETMRIRMRIDADGRRRTEMLGPMAVQGRVFIDDGTSWIAFFPDSKVLRVHAAARTDDDLDLRMALVHRNYALEIDRKPTYAGRPAFRVVAAPRDTSMRTYRFTIDAATCVPLETETVDSLGNVAVQFAVRRISFPSKLDKDAFDPPTVEGIRRESRPGPVAFKGREDAARRLGFSPVMAGRLPMGFKTQGVDLMERPGFSMMATKLTDGLVRLTVFQFRPGSTPSPPPRPDEGPKAARDVGDIHLEVRGEDVSSAVLERILAVYVRKLNSRSTAQEPSRAG